MSSPFELSKATALVTGVNDLVGMHVMTTLRRLGTKVVGIADLHSDLGSLQYLENEILRARPDLVFFVPSERYGIAVHRQSPGTVYYESVIVFAHLMNAARQAGVRKVVNVMSNCVYPERAPVPYRESQIWDGLPEATLIPHGMGRRTSLIHAAAYRSQYGLSTISLVLASVYGPHDNFDPASAQVLAAMIRRFVDAADRDLPEVVCWGSGNATREFLHVRDAVRGILEAALHYDEDEPLNIGSQEEVSISRLAAIIAKAAGYRGRILWDTSKPEGRMRVCLDTTRMRACLPHWEPLSLEQGVAETVRWFRASGDGFAG